MAEFQRVGATSNTHAGREFREYVKDFFKEGGLNLIENFPLLIGGKVKKIRKFNLGVTNPDVVVECKSYTWTVGGNIPSAKIKGLNEVMLNFSLTPNHFRKILVILKDVRRDESFASYYIRTQSHLIPNEVEIWEFDTELMQANRLS